MDRNEWSSSRLVLVRKLRLIVLKGNEILNDALYTVLYKDVILIFFVSKKKYLLKIMCLLINDYNKS